MLVISSRKDQFKIHRPILMLKYILPCKRTYATAVCLCWELIAAPQQQHVFLYLYTIAAGKGPVYASEQNLF